MEKEAPVGATPEEAQQLKSQIAQLEMNLSAVQRERAEEMKEFQAALRELAGVSSRQNSLPHVVTSHALAPDLQAPQQPLLSSTTAPPQSLSMVDSLIPVEFSSDPLPQEVVNPRASEPAHLSSLTNAQLIARIWQSGILGEHRTPQSVPCGSPPEDLAQESTVVPWVEVEHKQEVVSQKVKVYGSKPVRERIDILEFMKLYDCGEEVELSLLADFDKKAKQRLLDLQSLIELASQKRTVQTVRMTQDRRMKLVFEPAGQSHLQSQIMGSGIWKIRPPEMTVRRW